MTKQGRGRGAPSNEMETTMNKNNDLIKAIAISLMALNIILVLLGYIYVKQTNTLIEQNNKLINVEYSRCVNAMNKVGDKCSK